MLIFIEKLLFIKTKGVCSTNLNIISCNYRNSVTCIYYFTFVDSKVAGTVGQISERSIFRILRKLDISENDLLG